MLRFIAFLCLALAMSAKSFAETCDAALVQQTSTIREQSRFDLAWLQLVDQSNYEVAKKQANLRVGKLFSGGYEEFKTKRSEYYQEQKYQVSIDDSREELKSYLDGSQIKAWVDCKKGMTEIVITYANVTDTAATITLTWMPPNAVGDLTFERALFSSGSIAPGEKLASGSSFYGNTSFTIIRPLAGVEIRGNVVGTAGAKKTSYSQPIYIPSYEKTPPAIDRPNKTVITYTNEVSISRAYWAKASQHQDFPCLNTPSGYERFDLETRQQGIGLHKGKCVPQGSSFCDSYHEGCDEIYVTGCFVNQDWVAWYRKTMQSLKLAVTPTAMCAPE